jgi:hypothetical protein
VQLGDKKATPRQSVPRPRAHKRNRIALFLTFPIVVFAWCIGWSLYWIGYKEKVVKPKKMSVNEELTTTVTMPEMEYAIQHKAST